MLAKNTKRTTIAALCIVNLIILSCSLIDSGGAPKINETAPDFTLTTLKGKEVQLSQFRGRPVLINFWATWCQPCLEEMSLIQNRFEQHFPDLAVLAIEEGSSLQEISKIASRNKTTFLILRGNDEILRQYGVNSFPTTFLVDADGIIRSAYIGGFSPNVLDSELKKVGIE